MKKLLLLTAIAGVFAFSNVKAQDPAMSGPKLGVGVEFGFPMGDFGDIYNLSVGGSLLYQHPIANKLNFTANAGYLNFTGKDYDLGGVTGAAQDLGVVPVKVGLRYFLVENFFINGEVGAVFGTKDGFGTRFAYAPGLGVEFPVADKSSLELSARYEGWTSKDNADFLPLRGVTPQTIGLRLAWNFGL